MAEIDQAKVADFERNMAQLLAVSSQKQQNQIPGNDQTHHGNQKERHEGIEPPFERMVAKVGIRIEEDEEPDAGDEQEKERAQTINVDAERDPQRAHPGDRASQGTLGKTANLQRQRIGYNGSGVE